MAADDEGSGLIEPDTAKFFGRVNAEQAEFPRALQETSRKRPVFLLEAVDGRNDFLVRKLSRGTSDQAMLVRQALRREYRPGVGRFQ